MKPPLASRWPIIFTYTRIIWIDYAKETGLSVTKQLEKHRLDRACELLSLTKLSIGDIANQLGVSAYQSFAGRL